jgi:hypothetical protein
MKFRTEISVPSGEFQISHQDKILMMGSCFVENISSKLLQSGFNIDVNPFGIQYNPASLANSLYDILNNKVYTKKDLIFHEDIHHSWAHHSRFSGDTEELVLEKINSQIKQSSIFLKEASLLILSFGTARVYHLLSSGEIVSNCHKLPDKMFREEQLTIEQIRCQWTELIQHLRQLNPNLRIMLTVSPIRHWKNGAHENQLSKACLLLAVNELIKENVQCYYFPAYELIMDDLRDYRFYSDDMFHPNQQAIDYIWEKFSQVYFDSKTMAIIKEYEKIQKRLNHRPINKSI